MLDFIFITGQSGVGKTTLAKELYRCYEGVYFEQNMVPEFVVPYDVDDVGIYEEQLCWDNMLLQAEFFHAKGLKNIVMLDFDDYRTRELPQLFKGYRFIILRLVSSDLEQIKSQIIHRHENEGGLFDLNAVERHSERFLNRPLLPNEVKLDVAGMSKVDVLEAVEMIIDNHKPLLEYDYQLADEQNYVSWVQSRNLY